MNILRRIFRRRATIIDLTNQSRATQEHFQRAMIHSADKVSAELARKRRELHETRGKRRASIFFSGLGN